MALVDLGQLVETWDGKTVMIVGWDLQRDLYFTDQGTYPAEHVRDLSLPDKSDPEAVEAWLNSAPAGVSELSVRSSPCSCECIWCYRTEHWAPNAADPERITHFRNSPACKCKGCCE